ncbi:hypothetical protein ZHAS_00002399 [Anopheles sinensis]|uniref:Uncharacterized protein n=1 Tax=Anopheles sinensis TaxID=74873 RepID=A0A084VC67_ANOSI|nr:hypothetical protein ZHAS_00002399 [Anopheles sinensis]
MADLRQVLCLYSTTSSPTLPSNASRCDDGPLQEISVQTVKVTRAICSPPLSTQVVRRRTSIGPSHIDKVQVLTATLRIVVESSEFYSTNVAVTDFLRYKPACGVWHANEPQRPNRK